MAFLLCAHILGLYLMHHLMPSTPDAPLYLIHASCCRFECRKAISNKALPEPIADEHLLLDDNK